MGVWGWITGAGAAIAAEGLRRRETETLGVTRREIRLPCWPAALDGFRALVVADLHIHPDAAAPGGREERLAALLDETPCDVLLAPGDFANTRGAAGVAVEVLQHARARDGVYLTLGNGEPKRPAETPGNVDTLREAGRVLMNQSARLEIAATPLWIIGVDDPSQERDRLGKAARDVAPAQAAILLAHSPEIVTRLHRARTDLVVCGHTHGGQICIPGGHPVWTQTAMLERSSLGYGLFGPEDFARFNPTPMRCTRMYVTRGVGTAKLAVRAVCRPEIALLTLRSAESPAAAS
jgi:predicted MPP superfamily phosphohydrolase